MNLRLLIPILSTVVLIALGGFFWVNHGEQEYKRGYVQCVSDGAVLATKAAEDLKNVIRKAYSPSDVDRLLRLNGWLREDNDR